MNHKHEWKYIQSNGKMFVICPHCNIIFCADDFFDEFVAFMDHKFPDLYVTNQQGEQICNWCDYNFEQSISHDKLCHQYILLRFKNLNY